MTNSLDIYKLNNQIVYKDFVNAKLCSINLLQAGKSQFETTYKYTNAETFEAMCKRLQNFQDPLKEQFMGFALENLIDAIKIGICFENYFKAMLISEHYVVHLLDKSKFEALSKEQKKRPIHIDEVLKFANWKEAKVLSSEFGEVSTSSIDGILENTISYSTLLFQEKYHQKFNLSGSMVSYLIGLNSERNKLHLNVTQSSTIYPDSFDKFKVLIDFVNANFDKTITRMFDELGIAESDRKFEAITKRVPIENA